jgi:hypothetical protein
LDDSYGGDLRQASWTPPIDLFRCQQKLKLRHDPPLTLRAARG